MLVNTKLCWHAHSWWYLVALNDEKISNYTSSWVIFVIWPEGRTGKCNQAEKMQQLSFIAEMTIYTRPCLCERAWKGVSSRARSKLRGHHAHTKQSCIFDQCSRDFQTATKLYFKTCTIHSLFLHPSIPQSTPPPPHPVYKEPRPHQKISLCDNGRIKLVTHGVWACVSFVPSEGSCSSRRWRAERAWSWTRRWQAPSPHGGRNNWSSYSRVCGSYSSANKSAKHETNLSWPQNTPTAFSRWNGVFRFYICIHEHVFLGSFNLGSHVWIKNKWMNKTEPFYLLKSRLNTKIAF